MIIIKNKYQEFWFTLANTAKALNLKDEFKQLEMEELLYLENTATEIIKLAINTLHEEYEKKAAISSLVKIVSIDFEFSREAQELYGIFFPLIVQDFSKEPSIVRWVSEEIMSLGQEYKSGFLKNAKIFLGMYYFRQPVLFKIIIKSLAKQCLELETEGSIWLDILLQGAVLTESEVSHPTFEALFDQVLLPVYWKSVVALVQHKMNLFPATFLIQKDNYWEPPTIVGEEVTEIGQKIINQLTFDIGRSHDAILIPTRKAIDFFCKLTSTKPREQLLQAWQVFSPKESNCVSPKLLRILSKALDERMPNLEEVSVLVTRENFEAFFPQVTPEEQKKC